MEKVKVYNDLVVKFIFGREETKDLLLSFVNAVLSDSGLNLVTSLELKNPFNLQEFAGDKLTVLDIKAIDSTGKLLDIEIQGSGDPFFANRSLYYWAKLYSGQITESETYQKLKPVYCINILNFKMIENIDSVHTCYILTEKDSPQKVLTDHLVLHFIELPKVTNTMTQSLLDKWLQYFIHEGEETDIMETLIHNEPVLQKAHSEFKKFTADERLRDIYESRLKWQRDQAYYKEMEVEAQERGFKQGIEKDKIDIAKKMILENFDLKTISKITGLPESKIASLQ